MLIKRSRATLDEAVLDELAALLDAAAIISSFTSSCVVASKSSAVALLSFVELVLDAEELGRSGMLVGYRCGKLIASVSQP